MKFKYVAKEKISDIPKTAGVYSFVALRPFDKLMVVSKVEPQAQGKEILYIGKAANLRDRVRNHFHQPSYRDDLFIDQVERVGYIETESEIEALLLEARLIKQKQPRYNVMWKDGKQYIFVGISAEELPRVFLTHQPTQKARSAKSEARNKSKIPNKKVSNFDIRISDFTYIGPFVDGKAIKRTLRSLRKVFPYYTLRHGSSPRGSRLSRAGQAAKKHGQKNCQYCHLELCPGPTPNKKEYQKSIKNLVAVLQAQKPAVLKKLQREMALASKNQEYEKAGKLRDQIQDLEIIFSHARVLRPGTARTPLNWPETEKYLQKILGTKQRISRVEAYDISNIQGKEATGSMPVFINGKPAKDHYRKFKIHISGSPNDFAMLREVITRRLAHPEWQYPDLMIIDGGKGQLSAVLQAAENSKFEIRNSKPERIRIVAIAKRNNELFLPGQSKPLLLKNMPQGVSNFILHMRDEAHRFAITYHRLLRRKKSLHMAGSNGKIEQ